MSNSDTHPHPCQWTPCANGPPPFERRNLGPLANGSLRSKEESCPPPPPPPRAFFTKSHTYCLFLHGFFSLQWHVMGTQHLRVGAGVIFEVYMWRDA